MNGNIIHDLFVVTIPLSMFRLQFVIPANWEMPQSITNLTCSLCTYGCDWFSLLCTVKRITSSAGCRKSSYKVIKSYPPWHHSYFYEISSFVTLCMETGSLAFFKKCLLQKIHLIKDRLVFCLLHLNVLKGWCINKFNLSFRKILVNLISSLVFYLFTIQPHTVRYTAVKSVQIVWK